MEVIILPTPAEVQLLTAHLIAETVITKPAAVLGLATGRTMEGVYDKLVELSSEKKISYKNITTFNLDEYIGLAPDSPNSYRSFMNHKLFSKLSFDLQKTHVPNGVAADLERECEAYEAKIKAAGGIDLQLLGLGSVGHIGFNEPLSSLSSRTRTKSLMPQTRAQNKGYFGDDESKVPSRAITMGVGTILESTRALLVVTGKGKAEILAQAVEGPITSVVTGSALQLHRRCIVIVDEEAASKLTHREYYDWSFQNEPEWARFREILGS